MKLKISVRGCGSAHFLGVIILGKKRYKGVSAGRLRSEIIYEPATRMDSDIARQAKMQYSSMARQKLNNDTATHKLEMLLAANFTEDDYWVTHTYDDEHLPTGDNARHIAKGRAGRFVLMLNAARKIEHVPLLYTYGTESVTAGPPRLHHHFIINASAYTRDKDEWQRIWRHDLEQIKSMWWQGNVYVETFRMAKRRLDEKTPERELPSTSFDDAHLEFRSRNIWENVARYIVKERREKDAKPYYERAWNRSRSLRKPQVCNDWADSGTDLVIPPDAIVLQDEHRSNGFGDYHWIKYILPETQTAT